MPRSCQTIGPTRCVLPVFSCAIQTIAAWKDMLTLSMYIFRRQCRRESKTWRLSISAGSMAESLGRSEVVGACYHEYASLSSQPCSSARHMILCNFIFPLYAGGRPGRRSSTEKRL